MITMSKRVLGWQPWVSFRQFIEMMVDADLPLRDGGQSQA